MYIKFYLECNDTDLVYMVQEINCRFNSVNRKNKLRFDKKIDKNKRFGTYFYYKVLKKHRTGQ